MSSTLKDRADFADNLVNVMSSLENSSEHQESPRNSIRWDSKTQLAKITGFNGKSVGWSIQGCWNKWKWYDVSFGLGNDTISRFIWINGTTFYIAHPFQELYVDENLKPSKKPYEFSLAGAKECIRNNIKTQIECGKGKLWTAEQWYGNELRNDSLDNGIRESFWIEFIDKIDEPNMVDKFLQKEQEKRELVTYILTSAQIILADLGNS
jgi:hypothetical protein